MIRVDATSLDDAQFEKIKPVKLGNSYGVRQGDLVISMGSPAGMVHSSSYGFISYIAKKCTDDRWKCPCSVCGYQK